MNEPHSSQPHATDPADINELRAGIDAIDAELARLVTKRSSYAQAIASAKRAAGDNGFGWRPAREVDILRSLLKTEPDLDPNLAASIWRSLIASNLAAQGGLEVFATVEASAAARLAFGAASQTQIVASQTDVLHATFNGARAIGVVLWPQQGDDWWVELLDKELAGLHICAASPQTASDQAPEALLLAKRLPEASGGDFSLLAGRASNLTHFAGETLSTAGELVLVKVAGFVSPEQAKEQSVQLLGTFALA